MGAIAFVSYKSVVSIFSQNHSPTPKNSQSPSTKIESPTLLKFAYMILSALGIGSL